MIINYSLYDNHQIIDFGDTLSYKTIGILIAPHFRGIGTYTTKKSNISYTKNNSDMTYTKNNSDMTYTKNNSDISYIKNKSNISYT